MNKNFEMSKVLGMISLVLGITSSAIYLGFVQNLIATYQFTNGREQIAASIFKFHFSELKFSYALFFVTLLFFLGTLFFAYKGYRESK